MKVSIRFILLLAGIWSVAQAAPLTYTYTPIRVPGGTTTLANGLNNAGQIVGSYRDGTSSHGFLYSQGTYTTIDVPGGTATNLLGINNGGQIVGTYKDSSNTTRLFLDSNGVFTTINPPGGLVEKFQLNVFSGDGVHAGINDQGQIVSTARNQNPLYGELGFLYDNGQFTLIPSNGNNVASYYASGINNAGQISFTRQLGQTESAVYANGVFTTIPFYPSNIAYGINNAGDVIGSYTTGNELGGYVYSGGVVTTFPFPTSLIYYLQGINDAGQLVGYGDSGSFLATPSTAPEPGSVLLVGSGLSALGWFTRKKWKKA